MSHNQSPPPTTMLAPLFLQNLLCLLKGHISVCHIVCLFWLISPHQSESFLKISTQFSPLLCPPGIGTAKVHARCSLNMFKQINELLTVLIEKKCLSTCAPTYSSIDYFRGHTLFFIKDQRVNISNFAGHMVSMETSRLSFCSPKQPQIMSKHVDVARFQQNVIYKKNR